MRTLVTPQALDDLLARLARLTPDSPRAWGRMNAHQMVCHLKDSLAFALGEKKASSAPSPLPRPVMKFLALYLPMPWPKNVATRPEMDQLQKGTLGVDFNRDRAHLVSLLTRLAATQDSFPAHPIFGNMTTWQWMRWAYLHADHHLRQFHL